MDVGSLTGIVPRPWCSACRWRPHEPARGYASVCITILGSLFIAMLTFNHPENRRRNQRVESAIMQGKPTVSAPVLLSEQESISPQSGIPLAGADMDFVTASY